MSDEYSSDCTREPNVPGHLIGQNAPLPSERAAVTDAVKPYTTMAELERAILTEGPTLTVRDRILETARAGLADTERLDWLDEQREPVSRDGETLECYAWGVYGQNLGVREAIDNARTQSSGLPDNSNKESK
jgi:hypothetical protein